jgi:hypothetical protein
VLIFSIFKIKDLDLPIASKWMKYALLERVGGCDGQRKR